MSELKISSDVKNNAHGWADVLNKTLEVASYKKFIEVTSKHAPIVVKNDSTFYKINKKGNCHINCNIAEEKGLGKRVSGWYLMNEFTHEGFIDGMCRLVHHSNLMLADGTLINITSGGEGKFHIFIQDDYRDFDLINKVGFNDRMVFGDSFLVGRNVPRNKTHYAAQDQFDRDVFFEKFKIHSSKEEALKSIPQNLSYHEQVKWVTLKTTCHV
jgi:hypothetical protein